ncbi:tetratricopeptide repeat protein [Streptomyces cacaoi]|uniref:tetratricopeptide repeat protein n=1 Tax=Streptomyces cacaoi TaxID=1898 RepID=UPI003747F0A9
MADERLRAYAGGDAAGLRHGSSELVAEELIRVTAGCRDTDPVLVRARAAAAWLLWCRAEALADPAAARASGARARSVFASLPPAARELVPPPLRDAPRAGEEGTTAVSSETDAAHRILLLATALRTSHEQARSTADLDAALAVYRRAAAVAGDDGADAWCDLGVTLRTRHAITQRDGDVEEMVAAFRNAVRLSPEGPNTPLFLSNLSDALQLRFERRGAREDLDEAVRTATRAVDTWDPEATGRWRCLSNLGVVLRTRYEVTKNPADLDAAVTAHRRAEAALPPGHPAARGVLSNLANALRACFERTGQDRYLDDAIETATRAVGGLGFPPPPGSSAAITNLGALHRMRFERKGDRADLVASVDHHRAALRACPEGVPMQGTCLANLCGTLVALFRVDGRQEHLEEAVAKGREAVSLPPRSAVDAARRLSNLAAAFQARFEFTGSVGDLDDAIEAVDRAAGLIPPGHLSRALYLSNLAAALTLRFERTDDPGDLDRAVSAAAAAVDSTEPGHPALAARLTNLGVCLESRYKLDPGDGQAPARVEQAVTAYREALDLTPVTDTGHPGRVSNLASAQVLRHRALGDPTDLDTAVSLAGRAVALVPPGRPERAGLLVNLGIALAARAELIDGARSGDGDVRGARQAFDEALRADTAPTKVRVIAGATSGRMDAGSGRWREAAQAYEQSVLLLATLAWRGLDRFSQEEALSGWADLTADAVACGVAAGRTGTALELLESGRTVLWNNRLLPDLDRLAATAPALALRLREIRTELDG